MHQLDSGVIQISHGLDIPTAYLLSTYTNKEIGQKDSSAGLTLTQYFWFTPDQGAIAIDKYQGRWERLDPQVAWWDGWVQAHCYAEWLGGAGLCNQSSAKSYANGGYPISGVWYTMYLVGGGQATIQ